MKPYYFHPEALEEANQATQFYEERQSGLGTRFLDVLEDALTRIQRNPRLYQKVSGNIRKCRVLRFPYGIIFRDQDRQHRNHCCHAFKEETWILESPFEIECFVHDDHESSHDRRVQYAMLTR